LFFIDFARRRKGMIIFKVMNESADALPYRGGKW
jgi:hypothetical protein